MASNQTTLDLCKEFHHVHTIGSYHHNQYIEYTNSNLQLLDHISNRSQWHHPQSQVTITGNEANYYEFTLCAATAANK